MVFINTATMLRVMHVKTGVTRVMMRVTRVMMRVTRVMMRLTYDAKFHIEGVYNTSRHREAHPANQQQVQQQSSSTNRIKRGGQWESGSTKVGVGQQQQQKGRRAASAAEWKEGRKKTEGGQKMGKEGRKWVRRRAAAGEEGASAAAGNERRAEEQQGSSSSWLGIKRGGQWEIGRGQQQQQQKGRRAEAAGWKEGRKMKTNDANENKGVLASGWKIMCNRPFDPRRSPRQHPCYGSQSQKKKGETNNP